MRKPSSFKQAAGYFALTALLGVSELAWGVGISFNQLDWLNETGGYTAQDSDWGAANIQLSSADAGLFNPAPGGGYEGFLNVSTQVDLPGASQNWAVQNLPISFTSPSDLDGRLAESATFNLGILSGAYNLESLGAGILKFGFSISSTPAPSMPVLSSTAGVQTQQVLFGGEADPGGGYSGSSGQAIPGPAQNFVGALGGEKIDLVGKIFGKESDILAVNEEINGCAPGSVARSLKYMAAQTGIVVPGTVQDVYDILKDANHMNTSLGANGSGTDTPMIKTGKDKYVAEKGLDVKTRQVTDVEEAKKTLKQKGDVEIGIRFKGKDANGNDIFWGHRAFVTEITDLVNAAGNATGYTVKYLDDGVQGDGIASNTPHTITFNANGTGRTANVDRLINFQVEVVPEPGSLALLLAGLVPVAFSARRGGPAK